MAASLRSGGEGKGGIQSAKPTPSSGPLPKHDDARSLSAAEPLLHALAGIADFLDGFLHRRRRAPGLFGLIPHFVVLSTGYARSVLLAPACRLLRCRHLILLCGCCGNAARIQRFLAGTLRIVPVLILLLRIGVLGGVSASKTGGRRRQSAAARLHRTGLGHLDRKGAGRRALDSRNQVRRLPCS